MKLTLVISSLSCGGAEKVMSLMANYWAEKGWQVTLLTFDDGREPPFFDLYPTVIHRTLGIPSFSVASVKSVLSSLKQLLILRQAIKKSTPQAVISFMDKVNVLTCWAMVGLGLPTIVSERNNVVERSIGKLWNTLRHWTYPWTFGLVVQSSDSLAYFPAVVQKKGYVIPNPCVLPHDISAVEANRRTKTVIAMGRLTEQKGFGTLLKAFASIAQRHPEWSLVIWGEGEHRAELKTLRDELGIQGHAFFPGRTQKPFEKMKQADLFVLSSRFEGFPNVLCEAMACGLPVVSFDCPHGPREIIRDGIDGVLVPPDDVETLASAMEHLMNDPSTRRRLASRALEIVERFGLEKVMRMWEAVIDDAINIRDQKPGRTHPDKFRCRGYQTGLWRQQRCSAFSKSIKALCNCVRSCSHHLFFENF